MLRLQGKLGNALKMHPFHECYALYGLSSLTRKESLQLDLRRNKFVPSVALQVDYFTAPNTFLSEAVFGKIGSGRWVSNFAVHVEAAILIPVVFASAWSKNYLREYQYILYRSFAFYGRNMWKMPSLLLPAQLLVERSLILVYFQILSICKKGSSAPVSAPGGVLLIFAILLVMLLLLLCFNHEEKLIEWCERYVTKRLFAKRRLRMEEGIRKNTLDKYREEAEPKTQTITIRFQNLSLSLKKVTTWLWDGRGEGRRYFVINLQVTVNLMYECSPKVIFLTSESGTLLSQVLSAAKMLLWLVLLLLLLLL